jgi:hypothetical protein
MEDFGYQKGYDGDDKFRSILKRIFLSLAALFSVAAFIYVTVSAYNYVYESGSGEIITIKSPETPIKVIEEEEEQGNVQIDRKIYEDIFGSKKSLENVKKAQIQDAPQPAIPPAKVENKEVPKNSEKGSVEPQKIIVFSDTNKDKTKEQDASPKKDLLTKLDGEKRDNTAAPAKKHSGKKAAVRVQVAAMSSPESAKSTFKSLNQLYPTLFNDLEPFVEKVDLGKRGIFYRLQIGNFFNQIEAEEFCRKYVAATKKSRADCIVVE